MGRKQIAAFGIVASIASASFGAEYAVTDLSALLPPLQFAPQTEYAVGIDNNGQVAVDTSNGYTFLYSGGSMTEIGGPTFGTPQDYYGNGISPSGQVFGVYSQNQTTTGFYSDGTNFTSVPLSNPAGMGSLNLVVGSDAGEAASYLLFQKTDFASQEGLSSQSEIYATDAADILSVGVEGGTSGPNQGGIPFGVVAANGSDGFMYNAGTNHLIVLNNSAVGLTASCLTGINSNGVAVGYGWTGSGTDLITFDAAGDYADLGGTGGKGEVAFPSINDEGQIVTGVSPLLFSDGSVVNLNNEISPSSGWNIQWASGINDSGQIVGYGIGPEGYGEAFELTPVPEPRTTLIAAVGVTVLVLRRNPATAFYRKTPSQLLV